MQPIADFLQERLRRRTVLVTAPSLREFDLRFLAGAYDLAYVSPITARVAQLDTGMWPLLQNNESLYVVVVVRNGSGLDTLRDLLGRRVLAPDLYRASYFLGRELFINANVAEGIQLQPTPLQETAFSELLLGKCDAVVMNQSILRQMQESQRAKVRVIAESRRIPHAMFVAGHDATVDERQDYSTALTDFFSKTAAGKAMAENGIVTGLKPVTQRDMETLDTFAAAYRKVLQVTGSGTPKLP